MTGIDRAKLSAIPYLDIPNLQGRFISTLTFYDAGNWRTWIPAGDQLIEVKAWPAEAFYFSVEPESPDDLCYISWISLRNEQAFPSCKNPPLAYEMMYSTYPRL